MSLVRWDPMRELQRMSRRLEQAMEPFGTAESEGLSSRWMNWPLVDVYEDRDEIMLRAELPGLEQKEVEVVMEDSTLTLRGERKLHREDRRENYQRVESAYGTFSRSFAMPSTIDRDKVRAEMHNGILEVHVPKREGARGKNIPIKT